MPKAKKRTDYASNHKPGTHWATDEAWKILDQIKEGAIPNDVRQWLAGAIAGMLMRVIKERVD